MKRDPSFGAPEREEPETSGLVLFGAGSATAHCFCGEIYFANDMDNKKRGLFALFFFAKPDLQGQAVRQFRAVHRCSRAPAERMRCGRYLVSVCGSDAIPRSIILPKSIGSPDMDSSVSVSFSSVNTK